MANREIKTKVAIDGEKEYKESLKNINSALGTLKSELKLVESQYAGQANSYAALSAKGDVLSRMYDQQKEKVKAAAEQLEKAKKAQSDYAEKVSSAQSEISRCEAALAALGDETGDTTEEQAKLTAELEKAKGELSAAEKGYESTTRSVNSYQTQVNNAETELNKLGSELDKNASYMDEAAKSSDGCAESIDEYGKEVKKAGEDSEEAGKKFDKVKTAATALGTAAAAATAALAAAAIKLGKEVISAYADYEQLVGGVETLFKDSSGKVMEYANDAYKTAGLSANEYMETVTGFSASLISSLGGDTEKAAEYANMAITDMSDNANKMGSDMASIQNAYSGFAKQNYTMLDNLKLGYGGTKEEMQRLLEDAEKLSGVKYDISSYSDIIDAIHVIQTEMDITGTTAKEAEATISGSIGMLKSSFQNLITGLGDADADIDKLCDNVVNSFNSVVKNITPVVRNLAKTVPNALEGILDAIAPLLPELLEMGVGLFEALLSGFTSVLPELMNTAASLVTTLVQGIIEALPLVVDAAAQFNARARYRGGTTDAHSGGGGDGDDHCIDAYREYTLAYRRGAPTHAGARGGRSRGYPGTPRGFAGAYREPRNDAPRRYPANHRDGSRAFNRPCGKPPGNHYDDMRGFAANHREHYLDAPRPFAGNRRGGRKAIDGAYYQPPANYFDDSTGAPANHHGGN